MHHIGRSHLKQSYNIVWFILFNHDYITYQSVTYFLGKKVSSVSIDAPRFKKKLVHTVICILLIYLLKYLYTNYKSEINFIRSNILTL